MGFEVKKMDFIGKRKFWYILSLLVIIPGLISLMLQGLNLGIDFAGGTIAQVKFQQEVRIEDLRAELTDQGYGTSKIQAMDDGYIRSRPLIWSKISRIS